MALSNPEDAFAKLVDEGPVDQDKLLKDDEILSEEEKKRPENAADCGETENAKPKKPCANCTCGLADKIESSAADTETPKGSCGSCYLGDAFRCASCPYRGMPAFKPGEKVVIDTSDDL
uniref:Anamorsin n=1 Tax=Aceria tosichella TaxID=561515 RepID=A0A6G1SE95_9ACAR